MYRWYIAVLACFCASLGEAWAQPQWQHISLTDSFITDLTPHPTRGGVLFATVTTSYPTNYHLLRSSDYGVTWTTVIRVGSSCIPRDLSFHPLSPDTILAPGAHTYFRSTDCGQTWTERQTNVYFSGAVAMAAYLYAIPGVVFLAPSDSHWNIYRSEDGGGTFEDIGERPVGGALKLLTFPGHPQDVEILDYGPQSLDGGQSWQTIIPDSVFSDFWDMIASPAPGSPIYAIRAVLDGPYAFHSYLVKRVADGTAWDSLLRVDNYLARCAVSPSNGNYVVVTDSTRNHLNISTDAGQTWAQDPDPVLQLLIIRAVGFSSDGRYLYLAAGGPDTLSGLWRKEYSQVANPRERVPSSFAMRVFPNPFNSTISISLQLAHPENVSLTIFDIMGRRVTTLYSGWTDGGAIMQRWVPKGTASGVYYVVLQAGTEISIKPAVLLR